MVALPEGSNDSSHGIVTGSGLVDAIADWLGSSLPLRVAWRPQYFVACLRSYPVARKKLRGTPTSARHNSEPVPVIRTVPFAGSNKGQRPSAEGPSSGALELTATAARG